MLGKLLIAALLSGVAAAPAAAGTKTLLMPGVTYERQVEFTSHGPVALHVLTAPKPGGLWSLRPVLSNDAVVGRERVTSMQRRVSRDATVAGVNGDLFSWRDGRPSGMLMLGGALAHPPLGERSSLGIAADGRLRVDRVRMFGTWRGTGQRRPLDLNEAPRANGVSLFTPLWGPQTPRLDNAVEVVVQPFPAAAPNVDHVGTVVDVREGSAGGTTIPPDGAVLAAQGSAAQRLLEEAPAGTALTVRLLLAPDWSGVADAVGGGPVLVRDGRAVFRHGEAFTPEQLARNPRTAAGQLADGRIVLVVVDGRRPGYSVGMTNFDLALAMVRLGAVSASALDAGGSSTMAFDGALLNRPSDPAGERPVAEGLFVFYAGAYVAPPAEPVLSPNGDGVAESEAFAYKLPRPSRATVTLVGPGGVRRSLDAGDKPPGTYRFTWNGRTPAGTPEVEGTWRLTVSAVDDAGRASIASRFFSLNRTLARLRVARRLVPVGPRGGTLRATFSLARPARVTATVETPTGVVVAVALRGTLPAGRQRVTWNGRSGRAAAHGGRYVLRVTAANAVGRTDLAAPFSVRRVAR